MSILGLRDSENFASNERPKNFREGILRLYPRSAKAAPAVLTALTAAMKERTVDDPEFHWFEKELDAQRVELHATTAYNGGDILASASGAVEIWTLAATANAKIFKAGDAARVESTGEIVRIESDPTSLTSITVRRGWMGTTPAALDPNGSTINPNLLRLPGGYEESSLAPTGINFDVADTYNYCQIFRESLEMSETAKRTRLRTGEGLREAKRECAEYMAVQMEKAFLLGKRSITTLNNNPLRTTGGVINQIPSGNNVAYSSGQVSIATLEANLKAVFDYGSSEKVGLVGNRALLAIQEAVRLSTNGQYLMRSGEAEYGMKIHRLISPFGEVVLKSHPLLSQNSSGTNAGSTTYYGMDTWMFILDMDNIRYVNLTGRDVKYMDDMQQPGQDGTKAGYLGECGLELSLAKTHFLWRNMYTGVAG